MDDPPIPDEEDESKNQSGSALVVKFAERILGRLVETLPARIARNLVKAVEVTLVGSVDIWEEQLASWRAGIRAKSEARAEAWLAAGHAAGDAVKGDPELGVRAAHFLLGNAIRGQQRREDVVKHAAEILRDDPPVNDTDKSIDEDWLLLFTRVSECISKREMQEVLGRILAGEIKNPGAFSPFTLQLVQLLTPDIAQVFQKAANLSVTPDGERKFILAAPFGNPSDNALAKFGLTYIDLKMLETFGLISEVRSFIPLNFEPYSSSRFTIGEKECVVTNNTDHEIHFGKLDIVHFSLAGAELLDVLGKNEVPEYVLGIKGFFEKKMIRFICGP